MLTRDIAQHSTVESSSEYEFPEHRIVIRYSYNNHPSLIDLSLVNLNLIIFLVFTVKRFWSKIILSILP